MRLRNRHVLPPLIAPIFIASPLHRLSFVPIYEPAHDITTKHPANQLIFGSWRLDRIFSFVLYCNPTLAVADPSHYTTSSFSFVYYPYIRGTTYGYVVLS
jgi:hypothetical protein